MPKPVKAGTPEQKEMQEHMIALQILDHQLKQGQKQLMVIEQQATELEAVLEGLSELASSSAGSELFVPLSAGIFVKSELKDVKNVLVNVGSSVAVKKSLPEAKELLLVQIKELRELEQQLGSQVQRLASEAERVHEKVQNAQKTQ